MGKRSSNNVRTNAGHRAAKFFVGGLAPETTEDDMRQHFEQFGELVDVAVMRDAFGIPRCFGFVQYADPNLHACNPADDHVICNKKVDVKPAVPKEALDQGAVLRTNKIFVGGLSKASTADSVRAHFSQFGNVTDVLMKFDEMGVSRGFCFVEFDNEDTAELACQSVPMTVDDKQVECKLARPLGDKSLPGKGKGKGKGFFGKGAFGFGYGKGQAGPIRNDFYGKGARPSPYAAPPVRSAGKGYSAPPYAAAPAYGGRGASAGYGARGGLANGYGGRGGYGAATPYQPAPPAAPSYGGYGGGYSAPASTGYGSYSTSPAAYASSAPSYGGYSAGYGAAAAPAPSGYGGYAGYGQ